MSVRFDAILWDLDGTLVDSEPLHRRAILQVLDQFGVDSARLEPRDFVGRGERDFWAHAREKFELAATVLDLVDRKDSRYAELVRGELRVMPGAHQALDAFRARDVAMAIASGSSPRAIGAAVAAVNLGRYFRLLLSSLDPEVPRSKPHPDVFLAAARRLGAEPARCLVIEDAEWGVRAANAAGMPVVAIPNPWTRDHDLSGAQWQLGSLTELRIEELLGS